MKINLFSLSISVMLLNIGMLTNVKASEIEENIHNRCIVQLKDTISSEKVAGIARAFSARANASLKHVYSNSIKGFTINMPCHAAQTVFGDSEFIISMEVDSEVTMSGKPDRTNKEPKTEPAVAQSVSYGTTRVGGSLDGTGRTAWVIDSGVDLDHPDLNVDNNRAFSVINGGANDQNGHGTHVAGIIGAINNDIGTLGVAANTIIVPVRVLNRRGSGSVSGVIAGIDYVASNARQSDCVNLSLGGGISQILDNAVINAASVSGAYFTLAAGNESDDANNHSPARANGLNVYTISAIDENDNLASFSNYNNPPIDYAAPGVNIESLWLNGGTKTISGTSMAAPHACAVLMMTNGSANTSGNAYNDMDGNSDLIIHY